MGKANSTAKISFSIPNAACKFYEGFSVCGRDSKEHTCCQEECGLEGVLFGFQERSVPVHHKFEGGFCVHCGDEEREVLK